MKIIISPDKFKGSLTGVEFCNIVEQGIKSVCNNFEIQKLPLADGGDGTVEVLQYYQGGEMIQVEVEDPLGETIEASYLYAENSRMAFVEMAEASGIRLLSDDQLNPLLTSSFGTGQLILDAINRGAEKIILGIGGSSTNDAGMGMARALGYQFFDIDGNELAGKGADLQKLRKIETENVLKELNSITFQVACDVDNPLFGKRGAAYIYGPQKGANPQMVEELDKGLQNFNRVVKAQFGIDLQEMKGTGAAGGMGGGAVCFLKGKLAPGTELIKSVANFDEIIVDADWIITGEGKFDEQTFSGKVIKGVLDSREDQKLAIFCGISELKSTKHENHSVDYLDQMVQYANSTEDSIRNSGKYLHEAAKLFAKNMLQ